MIRKINYDKKNDYITWIIGKSILDINDSSKINDYKNILEFMKIVNLNHEIHALNIQTSELLLDSPK